MRWLDDKGWQCLNDMRWRWCLWSWLQCKWEDCHAFDNKNEQTENEDNGVRGSDEGRENLNTDQHTLIKKFFPHV